MPLKRLVFRLLSALYELVFGEQIGHQAWQFILSTSYVGIGTLLGALLSLAFSIIAARTLGPGNFGILGLVTTVAAFLGLAMGWGVTPMILYGSAAQDHAKQVNIVSTTYIQITLLTAAATAILALLSAPLSYLFGVPQEVFFFALVLGVTTMYSVLTTSSLRVFLRMRAYAAAIAAQSVITLTAFLVFISHNLKTWESAAFSYFVSFSIISVILVIYLKDYITLRFERSWAKKIMHYSLIALPGAAAGTFMQVDRILINKFLTTADVGIYNAYFLPSLSVVVMLWTIINATFFPYASKSDDKPAIYRNVGKATPYLAASLVPSVLLLEWIVFFFYGRQYHFSWEIALFFAIASTMGFFYQALSSLMASEGTRGAKVNTFSSFFALAILIGSDVILIPLIGISGAAITLVVAYFVATLYLVSRRAVLGVRIRA